MESSDPNICPLCQKANGCGLQAGKTIEECWCQTSTFPIKQSLSEAELAGLNKACICQACVDRLKQITQLGVKEIG